MRILLARYERRSTETRRKLLRETERQPSDGSLTDMADSSKNRRLRGTEQSRDFCGRRVTRVSV
jgi:hypothetical protein